MEKTAVIILNWNGAEMMRRYLPSVVAKTKGRIIVADNGSTDDSLKVLREEFPTVEVMALDKNYGFAEGYNRALSGIENRYTVLLNSDVRVEDGWLEALEEFLDTHEKYAAVQPKIRKDGADVPTFEHAGAAGGQIDCLGYPYARGRMMDYVEEDHGQYDTDAECFWASGAAMCVRTNIYREVGGLDAGFFAHMEEIDLCWRLQCRGWKTGCVASSVVYHLGGGSLQYGSPRKTYLNFRNNLLMLYKNMPLGRWLVLTPVRCAMDYLAALNDWVHGHGENAKAVVRARMDFWKMLPSYRAVRRANQAATKVAYPTTIRIRSIIFDYYVLHRKQ